MSIIPRQTGELLAITGMFDGVHSGHRAMITEAAIQAAFHGLTPVAVTFAAHPMHTLCPEKCPPLIMPPQERYAELRRTMAKNTIILDFDRDMSRLTAREFMLMLRDRYHVRAIFMGYNHHFGSDRLSRVDDYRRIAAEIGMEIIQGHEHREDTLKVSSSEIRKALTEGDVSRAASMLGRPFALTGTVVPGKQLGRTIGFPTANITPACAEQIIPAPGVYACTATILSQDSPQPLPAMVNIGSRPTVDAPGAAVSVEAHILDLSRDLYGNTIRIEFISRLRDEIKFPSLTALRSQLEHDAEETRKHISKIK
ncbi:MAG: riboflavin biosynthesis protein RibF [Muribaculaceae bacterium]|nr:riboflavin biosynthesis protein RibF [Muribaculaceae bacterium]